MNCLHYCASGLNPNFSDELKFSVFLIDWFRSLIMETQTVYKRLCQSLIYRYIIYCSSGNTAEHAGKQKSSLYIEKSEGK
jgi:hypothetical protein